MNVWFSFESGWIIQCFCRFCDVCQFRINYEVKPPNNGRPGPKRTPRSWAICFNGRIWTLEVLQARVFPWFMTHFPVVFSRGNANAPPFLGFIWKVLTCWPRCFSLDVWGQLKLTGGIESCLHGFMDLQLEAIWRFLGFLCSSFHPQWQVVIVGSFAYVLGRSQSEKLQKLQAQVRFFFLCALDVYYSPIATFNWFVHHSKHIIFLKNAFCDLSELVSFPSFFLF